MPLQKSSLTNLRLQILQNFDYEEIDRLISGFASYTRQEHKRIENHAEKIRQIPSNDDFDAGFEEMMLDDEHWFLDEVEKLTHELAVVALYKKIEITTKRAVSFAFPPPKIKQDSLYKIKELKKSLKGQGVDIESLPNYKAMDETRCINNDIKHNGIVGKELAEYSGWTKGDKLKDIDKAYTRLAPLCACYIKELVDALKKAIP